MISKEVKDCAKKIGEFYLEHCNGDHQATIDLIQNLQILDIQLKDSIIVITTARPGLLIGRQGERIAGLTKFMNTHIKIVEQDSIFDFLIPREE